MADLNRRARNNTEYERMLEVDEIEYRRKNQLRIRARRMSNDMNTYFDDDTSMERKIEILHRFRNDYGLGEDFNEDVFGKVDKDDQVIRHIADTDEVNDFEDNITEVIEEYHGTKVFNCFRCLVDIYTGENILSERINGVWSVPLCKNCLDPNNRPCVFCFERYGCVCNRD